MSSSKISDLPQKKDLALDDIQNEEWLIRTLTKVRENTNMDIDPALLDELSSIMKECSSGYHKKKPSLPHIKEREDMVLLGEKEARYVALLSRVAEIKISLLKLRHCVEDFWDICEDRLSRYPIVSRELTNERKRILFYRSVLAPLREKQSKIEEAFEISDVVEKYLNNLHFAVKEISELGRAYLAKSERVDYDQMR